MPNPLLGLPGRPSQTRVDRPAPVTPVPEVPGFDFNPYRGAEQHGVAATDRAIDPETNGFDATDPTADGGAHFVPLPDDPQDDQPPIPVKIVQEYRKEFRTFATDRLTVQGTAQPVQLLGDDENRTTVKITNLSADKFLWVARSREETSVRGYPLKGGGELSIATEEAIYVQSADGASDIIVAYVAEYVTKQQ